MVKPIKEQMDELMKSDEWQPTEDDTNWENDDNTIIMTNFSTSVDFKIDAAFIESMKRFNELHTKNQTYQHISPVSNYMRIYSITDDGNNQVLIASTSKTVIYAIKLAVAQHLQTGDSMFSKFSSDIKSTTFTVKLIELVNNSSANVLKTRKKHYENKLADLCVSKPKADKLKIKLSVRQRYAIDKLKFAKSKK